MSEADPIPTGPDPEDAWDVAREDPRPEPNPMRSLRQRCDAAEKAAKAWEERARAISEVDLRPCLSELGVAMDTLPALPVNQFTRQSMRSAHALLREEQKRIEALWDSAERPWEAGPDWHARAIEAEGRLSAANAQTRLWQAKFDELRATGKVGP